MVVRSPLSYHTLFFNNLVGIVTNLNMEAIMADEDNDANEEVTELAEAILRVAETGERLLNSRLTKRAIKVLIKDLDPRLSLGDIQAVLDALPRLKGYIK